MHSLVDPQDLPMDVTNDEEWYEAYAHIEEMDQDQPKPTPPTLPPTPAVQEQEMGDGNPGTRISTKKRFYFFTI